MTKSVVDALRAERERLEKAELALADERAATNHERALTRRSRSGHRFLVHALQKLGYSESDLVRKRAEREPRPPRGLAARDLKTRTQSLLLEDLLKREDEIARNGIEATLEQLRDTLHLTVSRDDGSEESSKAAQEFGLAFLDDLLVQFAPKEKRDYASTLERWSEAAVRAELTFCAGVVRQGLAELRRSRAGSEHVEYYLDRDGAELGVLERLLGAHSLTSRQTFIGYAEFITLEAAAPKTAHDGAFYREAWCGAVKRLSTRLLAHYQD